MNMLHLLNNLFPKILFLIWNYDAFSVWTEIFAFCIILSPKVWNVSLVLIFDQEILFISSRGQLSA